jgi:uncharacterized protein (DUF1778 family)
MVKTKNINVRIAHDEYENIVRHSQFFGSNISEFVLDAIRERLEYLEDVAALRSRDKNEPRLSWEEVQRNAGLL